MSRRSVAVNTVCAAFRKLGLQGEWYLSEALDGLGEAQLRRRESSAAIATLRDALTLRQKNVSDVWESALTRERLGEALEKAGDASAAAVLKGAAADLESQLGANHPQTLRAKSALAQLKV